MVSVQAQNTLTHLKQPLTEQRYIAEHNTIMRATVGSRLHGLAIDGWDDADEMGVCIEPPEYVLGLRSFEQYIFRSQPEGVRSGPGDLDLTIYGFKKYCALAAKGNPSIICLLFIPIESYTVLTPGGSNLRNHRDLFVSKVAIRKFLGYMTAQKEKLLGERGGMRVKRPELIEQFGYDTKYAMHALRLGYQGQELATSGNITYPLPEPTRTILRDVRQGKYSIEEITSMYNMLQGALSIALELDVLPQDPDWYGINQLMTASYYHHWEHNMKLNLARKDFTPVP